MCISQLAACHNNPIFKTNSLVELYEKVQNNKNLCEGEDTSICDQSEASTKPKFGRNNVSLNLTMDASIQLLEDSSKEAVNLLYFLACLPGGINQDELKDLWHGKDTKQDIELLENLSLLQPKNQ